MTKTRLTEISALVDRAIELGVVVKGGGGWLSFGDDKLGQGTEKAAAFLADNSEILAKLEAAAPAPGGGNSGGADLQQDAQKQPAANPSKKARGPLREFPVLSMLRHNSYELGPGDTVELYRDEFLTLKGLLVVGGEWPAEG